MHNVFYQTWEPPAERSEGGPSSPYATLSFGIAKFCPQVCVCLYRSACLQIYVTIYGETWEQNMVSISIPRAYICAVHVCMYMYVYYMYVCIYACMHVCTYACTHAYMYACMHVCMCRFEKYLHMIFIRQAKYHA